MSLRVADLPQNAPTEFDLRPDADAMKALAAQLELLGLRKLRFSGVVRALGRTDWMVTGKLGATVVQPCVVTLEPVATRIEADVERRFLADLPQPDIAETEMPEDDSAEPLGRFIDLGEIMAEALALNLPLYPRAEGADLGEAVFTEPGKTPMTDEDTKPFAGLANLRDKLGKKS